MQGALGARHGHAAGSSDTGVGCWGAGQDVGHAAGRAGRAAGRHAGMQGDAGQAQARGAGRATTSDGVRWREGGDTVEGPTTTRPRLL